MDTREPITESLELLRRARAGDSKALDDLLARYGGRLLDRVRLMMGDEARRQAESTDFLQQTLLEVVRDFGRNELNDDRAFLRWMTAVARNRIRDAVRKPREASFDALSSSFALTAARSAERDPSSQAGLDEHALRLAEAMEELDPELRQAIELRDFDGLSHADVGRALGCDEERARWLHRKATVRLGTLMRREA